MQNITAECRIQYSSTVAQKVLEKSQTLDTANSSLSWRHFNLQGVSGFVDILTPPLTLDRMVQS